MNSNKKEFNNISVNINSLSNKIIKRLPYASDFLFVDSIEFVDENQIIGRYKFSKEAYFYKSHFRHRPETPGVLVIEMMGQIGMVSHLIFIEQLYDNNITFSPVFANLEVNFLKKIYPEEILTVKSQKIYYRNKVLKSNINLLDTFGDTCAVCTAQLKLSYE